MFKIAIIEDDLLSQETLKDILKDFSDKYEVTACYFGVVESVKNLPQIDVDLVLLDMQLLDGLGLDILKQLEDIRFEVIITTMHDSFMLDAIKHSAIDYLLKPILKKDLAQGLERFEKKMKKFESLRNPGLANVNNRLVVPNKDGLIFIEIMDIIRLESDGAYTKLYVVDGSTHLISKNLGYYETSLADTGFLRIHHKHLINVDQIKNYLRKEGGILTMKDDSLVEVSRRKKQMLVNSLNKINGVLS